ncbi:flavin reductase family protein [uncultured Tateyamaria sp.]|uniref:flavin reductase family protein n=1 Tax=uncultured Tateyamaria sp. TaxID=455651 RepID=UPI00260BC239|nr:flavin reductase family protein [uncultured Tateyamaria sp.]
MTDFDHHALRSAFGSYMTGVTVVTTRKASGEPVGFTANSFTSVSLDPPLLLVCPGKFLSSFESFATCTHFAVKVLSEGQEDVSNTFANFKGDRFADAAHHSDAQGSPLIDGTTAQFSCAVERFLDAGDHSILIGRVQSFTHVGGRGLGYVGGQYFSLGLERAALDPGRNATICGVIIRQGNHVLMERTPKGFRPPQVSLPNRGILRAELAEAFAKRGLPIRLESAYSIFETSDTRYTYLLATSDAAPSTAVEAVAVDHLTKLNYCSRPVSDMMARFALETRERAFGLYLGDAERGDVHSSVERI